MPQPYALLRAGFPYMKTVGVKGVIDESAGHRVRRDGRVYVLGTAPIRITNIDHEDLGAIGKRSFGVEYGSNGDAIAVDEGELFMPVQVILDSEDNLYVTDEACHTISIFSKDGDFLGRWGEHGTADGQMNRPSGLAFDADENLYVVDTMNHRVQQFTKNGQFLKGWGSFGAGAGEFNMPWGVAIDDDGRRVYLRLAQRQGAEVHARRQVHLRVRQDRRRQGRVRPVRRVSPSTTTSTSTSATGATTASSYSPRGPVRPAIHGRRDALRARHRCHANAPPHRPPPHHGRPGDGEDVPRPALRPRRRERTHVGARLRIVPPPSLPQRGLPPRTPPASPAPEGPRRFSRIREGAHVTPKAAIAPASCRRATRHW